MGIAGACWRRTKSVNWTHLDCFESRLSRFFRFYGSFVSRHPWPFILFPILISAALSIGFLHKYEITDATYLYTPVGAPSKYERECIHEKWPLVDGNYIPGRSVTQLREAQSIVTAKDGGNILRAEYAAAVNRLNLFVIYGIRIEHKGKSYNYMDLCLHWRDSCSTNAQIGLVSTLFNNPNPNWANLTYPTGTFGNTRGYLASSLGGVRVNDTTTLIESAQAWLMLYQLQFQPDDINYVSGLWELEFQKRLLDYYDPYIDVTVFHSQTLSLELKRNAEKLAPRFVLSFTILVLFAMSVTFAFVSNTDFPYIDWAVSKPLLALCGVIGAAMGIGSAIGFLAYCGYMYNQIVAVMPFLILAVRLDNTFIMISAFRHTSRSLPAGDRISQALAEAASAITITVSTDFFSFLTGVASDIPAVQLFCVYTAVAIVITFFFQLTFFLGLLVLAARNEENGVNALVLCVGTVTPEVAKDRGVLVRVFNQGTRVDVQRDPSMVNTKKTKEQQKADLDWMSRWFQDWYAPVLMHPAMQALVLTWFCLYLGFCGYLCTRVRQGLEPVKLLVEGSYAIPHYVSLESYFWRNGSEMQLVVNNAPNLAHPRERRRVREMVLSFANTSHSLGLSGVQFWLDDFERYLLDRNYVNYLNYANSTNYANYEEIDTKGFYKVIEEFFQSPLYERLSEDVYWANVTRGDRTYWMIVSFRVSVGLTSFENSALQIETVNLMRKVASDQKYADLNITTFNPVWLFVDQYQEILPNVLQEVVSGMSFMVMIALLLIPHPMTSFWVAVTILSVDVGVIGFMTIWGINLDTISMITIIMSIGFSVDFAAHIAHAFVLSSDKNANAKEKVKSAMGEIAWPILQGATSTILGVVVLADLDSYMVVAFFKTVFLVIVLALIHGLVFLPVLLGVFVTRRCGAGQSNEEKDRKSLEMGNVGTIPASHSESRQDSGTITVRSRHSSKVYPTSDTPVAFNQSPIIDFSILNSNQQLSIVENPSFGTWTNGGNSNPAYEPGLGGSSSDFLQQNQNNQFNTARGNYADSRM